MVIRLILHGEFNQPIQNLPNSLIYLLIYGRFNQPIDYLPDSLIKLWLGDDFNHPLYDLPNSLAYLRVGTKFNHPLNNLPQSLETIEFGYCSKYSYGMDGINPDIELLYCYDFSRYVKILPFITHMFIIDIFDKHLDDTIDYFPPTLKYITLDNNFTKILNNLPDYLEHLTLNENFNLPLQILFENIPSSLKTIEFESNSKYSYGIEGIGPNIKLLTKYYDINDTILPFITHLEFYDDNPIINLPKSLKYLKLDEDFNHPIDINILPEPLEIIEFEGNYLLDLSHLPPNIKIIRNSN